MKQLINKSIALLVVFSLVFGQIIPGRVLAEGETTPESTTTVTTTQPATPALPAAPQEPEKSIVQIQQEEEAARLLAEQQAAANATTTSPITDSTQTVPTNISNSGSTSDSSQVGDATVNTGDATTNGVINATGNTNVATSPTTGGSGTSITNDGNGTGSTNTGSATTVNNSTTDQTNSAVVNNNLEQASLTGNNDASRNTAGNAMINTGDANTSGTIVTSVNTNVDGVQVNEFNIVDDHVGDIILDMSGANCVVGCSGSSNDLANTNNGADSTNSASTTEINNSTTNQDNTAVIGNDMVLVADSGNNTANSNTGGDSTITTGDANIAANIMTMANNNFSGNVIINVVNIFGDLLGDLIFSDEQLEAMGTYALNSGNGADSTNTSDSTVTNNNDTFQSNTADIDNNLIIDANTGNNATMSNTGGDNSVSTGDIDIDANILNIVNSNISGGNWWIVLVNEAGNWVGKIMGAPEGTNFAASAGTDYQVDENGYITAVNNSDNGADSTNTSSANQTNNSTTTQTNNATVENNMYLDANTGNNSASRNTGGNSSIDTGDINILANMVNFVNNNIATDGKLILTIVNVFGDWTGNFFTPDQKKTQPTSVAMNNTSENNTANNEAGRGGSQEVTTHDSDKEDSGDVAVTTTSSNTGVAQPTTPTFFGTTNTFNGNIANVNSDDEGSDARVAGISDTSENIVQAAAKNVLSINLAWLILLAPVLLLGLLVKKSLKRHALSR